MNGAIGQNRAARDPLELLAQNRSAGPAVTVPQHSSRHHEEQRQISHLHPVEIPAHAFAGLQKPEREDVNGQQHASRDIDRGNHPAMLADEVALLREGQNKMQKQSRLQQPRHHIAPVDRPVKFVQLSAELEGVENERNQAENVEVGRTGRRPAAQQDVKPDAEIDQGNEPQPVVE